MDKNEMEARFAAIDERIAELDAVLAVLRKHLPATESPFTLAERVAGLESWAETTANDLDTLRTGPVDAERVVIKGDPFAQAIVDSFGR